MEKKSENYLKKSVDAKNGIGLSKSTEIQDKHNLEKISTTADAKQLVEQLGGFETENEDGSGSFSEDEGSYKPSVPMSGSDSKPVIPATVFAQPAISDMIKQTVIAIETELKKNEVEMKSLMRSNKTSFYLINDKAKQIRFLNGILLHLKKAARVAEDFIVGLWKQYVKRV